MEQTHLFYYQDFHGSGAGRQKELSQRSCDHDKRNVKRLAHFTVSTGGVLTVGGIPKKMRFKTFPPKTMAKIGIFDTKQC
jgi:hypothetical protein